VVSALRITTEEWEDERGKAIDFVPGAFCYSELRDKGWFP
jgi:hypothetical protein